MGNGVYYRPRTIAASIVANRDSAPIALRGFVAHDIVFVTGGPPMTSKIELVLRYVLALLFMVAAMAKLASVPMMVAEFRAIGMGQWFRYLVAGVEIAGAGLLILPLRTFLGAGLLLMVCLGALIAQLAFLHGDLLHVLALGAPLAWIAWRNRPSQA